VLYVAKPGKVIGVAYPKEGLSCPVNRSLWDEFLDFGHQDGYAAIWANCLSVVIHGKVSGGELSAMSRRMRLQLSLRHARPAEQKRKDGYSPAEQAQPSERPRIRRPANRCGPLRISSLARCTGLACEAVPGDVEKRQVLTLQLVLFTVVSQAGTL